jgi:hypothetical protein
MPKKRFGAEQIVTLLRQSPMPAGTRPYRRAGHRPEGDRRNRGSREHPHDGDVRRGQPEAAGSDTAGGDVMGTARAFTA